MHEKILSVFVDESGDFGLFQKHAPYYLVVLVLHQQENDISGDIRRFDDSLKNHGYTEHTVHTGPLVRRESVYRDETIEMRRRLFRSLFQFARVIDFKYISVMLEKTVSTEKTFLIQQLSSDIRKALSNNEGFFRAFDKIIVYYDNGQLELKKILHSVFESLFFKVEFRNISPADYRLFQVADLLCTMELISEKMQNGAQSRSETEFFRSRREFSKNYMRHIERKRL